MWTEVYWNQPLYQIFHYTLEHLVTLTQPDLITVAGDLTKEGDAIVFKDLCKVMDSYKIPWVPILGNHDHHYATGDTSAALTDEIVEIFADSEFCTTFAIAISKWCVSSAG